MAAAPIYGRKTFKNLILQNQEANDVGTWYVTWGCWAYQVCSNNDPRLTLTYLTSWSNLLPNAFKWEIFWKVNFLNTVEAKVIILTWYVKTNETMAINKFQRSRLTFDLSAKVDHIGVPSTYLNIVFSEPLGQWKSNFIWPLLMIG